MRVIKARNVHEALPKALQLMECEGVQRNSRNGMVLQLPDPVTTVYANPQERVIFWPERDANPAFHLYESLWMLQGRNDLKPLLRYVKSFDRFSDNGVTLYGAYGWRWRKSCDEDQLRQIATMLRCNPDNRRCVLEIWMGMYDLGRDSKDIPCNLIAVFQVNVYGALDMTVFNRSNDIVLGAYGANAVHFSMLHEYMAIWVGVPIGVYRQVSCNWHAYEGEDYYKVKGLTRWARGLGYAVPMAIPNPYAHGDVHAVPLITPLAGEDPDETIERFDKLMNELVSAADNGFAFPRESNDDEPWFDVAWAVLRAHHIWRTNGTSQRFELAKAALRRADQKADWIVAMKEWLDRREARSSIKQAVKFAQAGGEYEPS